MSTEPFPYTILAIAPFGGDMPHPWKEPPISADLSAVGAVDAILSGLTPCIDIELTSHLCPQGGIRLSFPRIETFSRDGLCQSQTYLRDLKAGAAFLEKAAAENLPEEERAVYFAARPHLPPPLPHHLRARGKPETKDADSTPLDNILAMVSLPEDRALSEGRSSSNFYHDLTEAVIDHICDHAAYTALASAWQGLEFLFENIDLGENVQVKLVPSSQENLQETLELQESALRTDPPALILLDYPLSSSAVSLQQLRSFCELADSLLVPTLAWIGPSFFHLGNWLEMDRLSYLPNRLDAPEYGEFRKIRTIPGAGWVNLSCNRMRGMRNTDALVAPVWGVASLIARRFSKDGTPAGAAGMGNQIDMAHFTVPADEQQVPVEAVFSEERVEQLLRCGITPLSYLTSKNSVFMVDDAMLAKDTDFGYQALVSILTHLVLEILDRTDRHDDETDYEQARGLEAELHRTLATKFRGEPGELAVQVEPTQHHGIVPISLHWKPGDQILGSRKEIELTIAW